MFRERMWKLFIHDVGNYAFLHNYKKLLDNLLLDIDIGFANVSDVRSKCGSPQGLKLSCYLYIITQDYILRNLLTRIDKSKVFVVDYSDDILLGATCPDELRKAMSILDELFAVFNLTIDHSKTQLIRSNTELPDSISII